MHSERPPRPRDESFRRDENFRRIVASINDVLYSIDGKTGEFTYLSASSEHLLGYTLADIERIGGRRAFLRQVIGEEKLAEQEDLFQAMQAVEITEISTREAWWRRADDTLIYLEDRSAPVYEGGRLVSVDGILSDITKRNQAEMDAQRRAAQAALIFRVGQRISSELELDALLAEIVTAVHEAFDYYNVLLMLLDQDAGKLVIQAIAGGYSDDLPPDLALPLGEGMMGYAAQTGEVQLSGNVTQNPHYIRAGLEKTTSELAVPIKSGPDIIGVLDLQSDRYDAFDETDISLMETLSAQIAVAIENARLFEEATNRAERLAVVNRIAKVSGSTLDLDHLARAVYHEVTPIFQADAFFFALCDEETGELNFRLRVDDRERAPIACPTLDETLSATVLARKKPLIIRDLGEDGGDLPIPTDWETGYHTISWLGAPMLLGDRAVGVISVQSHRPDIWDDEDELLLFIIADQVAAALDNLRLLEKTRRRAQEMEAINEVGRTITSVLDLSDLLTRIVDVVKAHFGYYFVCIVLADGERLTPRSQSCIGDSTARSAYFQLTRVNWTQDATLTSEAMRTEQPVVSNDVLVDPRYLPLDLLPDTRSELCLPIKVSGRVIGVLDVQSDRPHAFDSDDVDILQALAHQAGVAIDNARLFEQAQERARELAVLNELGQALTARLNVEEVMDEAYRGASSLIDTDNFYIGLYDAESKMINFAFDVSESEIDQQFMSVSVDEGITGYVIRHRRGVLINENLDEWLQARGIQPVGEPARSWIGVPLVVGDRVLGAIGAQSFARFDAYDEHDLELLTAIASQTAIALQNAYLYEQAQHEIAERKRAEEQLRQSEERYRAVAETAIAGIGIIDSKERVTFANPALTWMLAYETDELLGMRLSNLIGPEGIKRYRKRVRHIKVGAQYQYESPLYRRDGRILTVHVSASPLTSSDGSFQGTLIVVVDITERKRAEQQLKRYADDLEQSNEDIKQFAYIVSHDLRAPLVNLKGFSSELQYALDIVDDAMTEALPHLCEERREKVTIALQEDIPEALGFIDASINWMSRFTNAVLKLSRLGRRELQIERVDVDKIVRTTLQTLAHQVEEQQIKIKVDPLPDVIADKTAMEQIVGNVVGNAVKYLDPERPGRIEVTAERRRDGTIFHVRDNGRGIAEADMEKTFMPFRRAGQADVPGEGMGLAYVQVLLRRHGGRIWCQSTPGEGTTFSFLIPHLDSDEIARDDEYKTRNDSRALRGR
jgi:PAS domain S-box-containing protein